MTALLVQMALQETEMVNSAPRLPLFDFATPPLKVLMIQGGCFILSNRVNVALP